jgi:hypothetical protein
MCAIYYELASGDLARDLDVYMYVYVCMCPNIWTVVNVEWQLVNLYNFKG